MTSLKNKLVTLIGGGGFIGRYAAQALLKAGARVRIAGRDPRHALFLKPQGGLGQTQFVAVDVTKPASIARAVAGADMVVNLVGILAGDFEKVHVQGARNVAEAAAAVGVERLVHFSALGASEDSPSVYGRSKAAGEAAVRAAFPGATILRPSIVFGREDNFINRFAAMIEALPMIPVVKPGARFQPIYVADLADAVAAALSQANAMGQTLELGGPDVVSMLNLLRWIAKAVDRDPSFVELPDFVSGMIALFGFLPLAPITADQWKSLQRDSVVTGANGLDALGITPTPMDSVAPNWLVRYRRGGRFDANTKAPA